MKCIICNKSIKGKDNYVILAEYKLGKPFREGYYHTKCFRDRFLSVAKIQKRADRIMGLAEPLLEKAQGMM